MEEKLEGKATLGRTGAHKAKTKKLLSQCTVHLNYWTNKVPYFVYTKLLLDFSPWHRIQVNRIYICTIDAANNIKYFVY